MSLKTRIQEDTTQALKAHEDFLLGTLRMLLAAITTKEKDKRYKISKDKPDAKEEALAKESELTDEQILEVIFSEIKKRKDAIALYTQGNRPELAEREKKEADILKKYLPEQLSEQELKKLVTESITKTGGPGGHPEMKDMGRIMADLMLRVKGRADNSEISKIVKELLTK